MAGNGAAAQKGSTGVRLRQEAARLFHEQGYAQTSMQDVADAVHLLKGSLYYHIDSKEDLLYQVLLEVRAGSLALIDEVRALTDLPAIERLREYVRRNVAYNAREVRKGAIYYREFGHLRAERRDELGGQSAIYEDFVMGLIAEAKRDGSIAAELDSRVLTKFLFAIINSVFDWYRPSGRVGPDELAELYGALAIRGVQGIGDADRGPASVPAPSRRRGS